MDDKAFIFTLKNPHGVPPTRFMTKGNESGIWSYPSSGPSFWGCNVININIGDKCNKLGRCWIKNDGTKGYECHPLYKKSLFVNTDKPNEINYFIIDDYEVYCIDYENKYTVEHLCKYKNIIWSIVQTKDISEKYLEQFDDDIDLLNDLDAIHFDNSDIRLKISHYYFKNPSEFLPNTSIVSKQYDAILREWIGNCNMILLYRASEHGYTAKSFHQCCDDKGPTLVIIKSSGGWIFGGYTTQSWSGSGIYNDMIQ